MTQKGRSQFIQDLAKGITPVKAVPTVTHQLSLWVFMGVLSSIAVAYVVGLIFPGFGWVAARYTNPLFWLEQGLLFLAAFSAAWSALLLSRPGRDQAITKFMSLGTLLLWSLLGVSYLDSFLVGDFSVMPVMAGYKCLVVSVASVIPAGALMLWSLRKGYVLNQPQAMFFGLLATSSLGAFALQFFCPSVDGLIKLVWHILPIYGLSAILYLLSSKRV